MSVPGQNILNMQTDDLQPDQIHDVIVGFVELKHVSVPGQNILNMQTDDLQPDQIHDVIVGFVELHSSVGMHRILRQNAWRPVSPNCWHSFI